MNVPARKAPPAAPPATLEDLYAIPEEKRRHELIEGVIHEKGAATGEHGRAQRRLSGYVEPFDRRPGGRFPGGWWFATEVDIFFDPKSTFVPDVAGWRRERVPEQPLGTPIRVRPDWVCEILSTNRRNDLVKKKRVYHRHEVPHCWIVDPVEESLSVYRWEPAGYLEILVAERGERVRAEPFDAIPLQVGILFGDDEEDEEPAAGEP
ncbi:Uma2 family endonuclease [Polyangium sp. 15x6]|uniref:Uma2 family endonuclease n=1 Tax=Polyangium sp. 15x6 TaxID=3042687 RepID=UPI00249AB5AB|nr:Uma2 family endonuclease [Polyangium sp. 15x6]MDI3287893.1 Uma2 family endonuclease [Polyangium sp. 15x6]